MPLAQYSDPFNHEEWIFEVKFDGFRALAYIQKDQCQLLSRKGNLYKRFDPLRQWIAESLVVENAILDGELVCLDSQGYSQFYDLLFRRREPYFYAFDLLWLNGEDLRDLPLLERKSQAERDHPTPTVIFAAFGSHRRPGNRVVPPGLRSGPKGIVAKWGRGSYSGDPKKTSWIKIKNPTYSQTEGRAELFHPPEKV